MRMERDLFLAAFAEPGDAVRAAIAGQQAVAGHRWPEGVRVRVAMAIHSGRVAHTSTGYAGLAVHQVGLCLPPPMPGKWSCRRRRRHFWARTRPKAPAWWIWAGLA